MLFTVVFHYAQRLQQFLIHFVSFTISFASLIVHFTILGHRESL